ncbi:Putative auto-transporter adhesin, head GIN domain [Pedobacter westerhofensis]|uniref:Auto-transporter adhesin, head GIN domain n=1 Tax=Pedobacter westerhofensis TaxID=425512 RepID=A0A521CSD1_9SPHI|nr:DUF2807 domain-containing protein [Pedobacter westerhofensis]SMO62399.1 Putative auto-transporter adhesin, head GIN domain [Pedobacter westerhofensis]
MNKLLFITTAIALITCKTLQAQEVVSVAKFDRVIVSPHVQVTFTQGDKEAVTIENLTVGREKVNIESNGQTLRVYLEGAKEVTKNEKVNEDEQKRKEPLYKGTVLTVAISYKTLHDLSVRGEETIHLKSKIEQENFNLVMYGEAQVDIDEVQLKTMHTTSYGESSLMLKSGSIAEQRFTSYGESKIDALAIKNSTSTATLYGEAELRLNVSDQIKVTSFGEAKIGYKGSPAIKRGLNIGKVQIYKID